MDITIITDAIDAEILRRSSDKFGIKVGWELYKELAMAGKIKLREFSAFGTGAFPVDLPAYNGKYFISLDWDLNDYECIIGDSRP